jgi:hypothetical protein
VAKTVLPPPRDMRFAIVASEFDKAEVAFSRGDIATSAGHAHMATKYMLNLADELRFEQGVKAGFNRAATRKKTRKKAG